MNEAETEKGQGISYSDFLAQWDDDREDFEWQWRRDLVQEVRVPMVHHESSASADQVSVLSSSEDGSDSGDNVARLNFIEGKALSERKVLERSSHASEPKSPAGGRESSPRRVMFQDEADVLERAN